MNGKELLTKIVTQLEPQKSFARYIKFTYPNLTINKTIINLSKFPKVHFITIGKSAISEMRTLEKFFRTFPPANIGERISYSKKKRAKLDDKKPGQYEGDHPFTSEENFQHTGEILNALAGFKEEDLVIFSISGGTSALLEQLPSELTFQDYDEIQQILLKSTLAIEDINLIRKSISLIKNGGLTTSCPCRNMIAYISNDTPTGDIHAVGSSPLMYKKTNLQKVHQLLSNLNLSSSLLNKVNDVFNSLEYENIQLNKRVQQASKKLYIKETLNTKMLEEISFTTIKKMIASKDIESTFPIYNKRIEDVIASEIERIEQGTDKSFFLSGGEAPVELPSKYGQGGRNSHYCCVMAKKIFQDNIFNLSEDSLKESWVLSFATDGTDGNTNNAGGLITFENFQKNNGIESAIKNFNTWEYLKVTEGLLNFPETGINIMDLRIIYIKRKI